MKTAADPQAEYTVVAEFPKSNREVLRVQRNRYRGQQFIDARVWFHDATGELRATQKGVTVTVEVAPQLIEALQQAYAEATGEVAPVG